MGLDTEEVSDSFLFAMKSHPLPPPATVNISAVPLLGMFLALILAAVVPVRAVPVVTTVFNFDSSTGAGGNKSALVQGADGSFYGTTYYGPTINGVPAQGSIYKVTPDGAFTTLVAFNVTNGIYTNGANPNSALVLGNDGFFYGTTKAGGVYGYGTIFQITPAGVFTSLHSFDGTDGIYPNALTLGEDGNFYGTTAIGYGADDKGPGTVFKITPAGIFTTLARFGSTDTFPSQNPLIQADDGNFYGTTRSSATAYHPSEVFKVTPSGNLTIVRTFTGAIEGNPSSLSLGSDGDLYGTTEAVSSATRASVLKMSLEGTFSTLFQTGASIGFYLENPLKESQDGDFYGTSTYGGPYGNNPGEFGCIFKMTPEGAMTNLFAFTGAKGSNPCSALIEGADGALYGTTQGGGANGRGTIFKLTQPDQSQTITFPALSVATYGTPVSLNAHASSGLQVTYRIVSGGATVIGGNSLATTAVGTVVVAANQAGNGTFMAAAEVTRSLTVFKGNQTVTFPAVAGRPFNSPPVPLLATASSGLPLRYSILSGPGAISGNLLTFTALGTVTVQAFQAGNANYNSAGAHIRINGTAGTQTITFPAMPPHAYGDAPFELNATASSGLPVTYSVQGPASLSGNQLTLTGPGKVTVTAFQAGDATFRSVSAKLTFTVAKMSQTVTFPGVPARAYNSGPIALMATASSGLPITYSILSGSGTVAGNLLTFSAPGTVTVQATQPGNAIYLAAGVHIRIIGTGVGAAQTITFPSIPAQTFGGPPLTLAASASSGLPVTYKFTGPAVLSGSTLTVTGAGSVTVTASQVGSASYATAKDVVVTFAVNKASQNLTFPAIPNQTGETTYLLQATSSVGLPVVYSVTGPASLAGDGKTLSFSGAGTVTVSAGQAGNADYLAAAPVSVQFEVVPRQTQTITFPAISLSGSTTTLHATASSGLPVTYAVVSGSASISGNVLTVSNPNASGVTVSASQAGNATYAPAPPVQQTVKVLRPPPGGGG